MGGLDGTSSSWINPNGPNWPQTPSSEQQWTNELPKSNQVPGMLPQPPMNQCSGQFPYQFNQVPITPNLYDPQCSTMLPEPSQTLRYAVVCLSISISLFLFFCVFSTNSC
ncbi:hypothetical protein OIU79_030807 [Salix purpurea]|uniref:Uncharacterized protein n=1 Tax=Salix purpurea TaxID=77065 RepID=A0A9Q0ZRR0_SALPP|nr:hypothetical protein OIU79_030807 [Salix purpurea]